MFVKKALFVVVSSRRLVFSPSPLQMKHKRNIIALPNVCRWPHGVLRSQLNVLSTMLCGYDVVFSMVVRWWFTNGGLLVLDRGGSSMNFGGLLSLL